MIAPTGCRKSPPVAPHSPARSVGHRCGGAGSAGIVGPPPPPTATWFRRPSPATTSAGSTAPPADGWGGGSGTADFELLVEAMARLPHHRLVLAGRDDDYRARLGRASRNVVFVNALDRPSLRWLVANASAVIGASVSDPG